MTQTESSRSETWSSQAWPALHPAVLNRLPLALAHPSQLSLPPSLRYRPSQRPTLQDEADALDIQEDMLNRKQVETREYGFSWIVPLGRQNTQEEDAEVQSAFTGSPRQVSPGADQTADGIVPVAADADAAMGQPAAADAAEVDLDAQVEDREDESDEDDEDEDDEEEEEEEDEEPEDAETPDDGDVGSDQEMNGAG